MPKTGAASGRDKERDLDWVCRKTSHMSHACQNLHCRGPSKVTQMREVQLYKKKIIDLGGSKCFATREREG